jgi:hypothetical protein
MCQPSLGVSSFSKGSGDSICNDWLGEGLGSGEAASHHIMMCVVSHTVYTTMQLGEGGPHTF